MSMRCLSPFGGDCWKYTSDWPNGPLSAALSRSEEICREITEFALATIGSSSGSKATM
jgi:hypothetical protein